MQRESAAMSIAKLQFNESHVSEVKRAETFRTNYAERGGYNAPQLALGIVSVIPISFQSFHCENI